MYHTYGTFSSAYSIFRDHRYLMGTLNVIVDRIISDCVRILADH